MSPNSPIEIDPEDLEVEGGPQPVPVPVPAPGGATPQPVPVPPKKPADADEAIALVEDFDEDAPSQHRAFGAASSSLHHEYEFKRTLNVDGSGATRCKLFHSKISDGPLMYMQQMINEWLDSEKIEVKFVTQSIGVMEGKRAEPNVIVVIWY